MKIKKTKISDLIAYENNARTHSPNHVDQIAKSIKKFGFNVPVLVDSGNQIIAGHGRVLAAEKLKMNEVPTICIDHLTEEQKKAFILADNRIALNSGWDNDILKSELESISSDDLNFDFEDLGFSSKEIDKLFESDEKEEPEVVFSEEIGEQNNYIVLVFENDIDWLNALSHFNLKTVHAKRTTGKPWSKGIGRVVNGAKYLEGLNDV